MSPKRSRTISGREIARRVLRRVRGDGAYANLALSAELERATHLPSLEKGLATELVYGVLRAQRLLDHALGRHLHRPLGQLGSEASDILRLSAYQQLLLDRVPAYAAVDDAVAAMRRARGATLAGLANAVLRRLNDRDLREGLPSDPVQRLAVECSLPDDLAEQWTARLGLEEAGALAAQLLRRAPLTARTNTLKIDAGGLAEEIAREGGRAVRGTLSPLALQLSGLPDPFVSRSYLSGLWTAQDEAAQLVAYLVDPRPGEIVLDACAGVGGKATHLAAMMENKGQILCVDSSARKLELLREHCLRLGITICSPRETDLRLGDAVQERSVHRVLLDAPCSALGVMGRHPDLKWRLDLLQIPRLAELQRQLLIAALRALRPGGILVYSVCTTTEEEGEAQVRWLCEHVPHLELLPSRDGPMSRISTSGMYRLWPHRHGTDGFFMARFRLSDAPGG